MVESLSKEHQTTNDPSAIGSGSKGSSKINNNKKTLPIDDAFQKEMILVD